MKHALPIAGALGLVAGLIIPPSVDDAPLPTVLPPSICIIPTGTAPSLITDDGAPVWHLDDGTCVWEIGSPHAVYVD